MDQRKCLKKCIINLHFYYNADSRRYDLYEIFNFGKIRGGKFIVQKIGNWDEEKGKWQNNQVDESVDISSTHFRSVKKARAIIHHKTGLLHVCTNIWFLYVDFRNFGCYCYISNRTQNSWLISKRHDSNRYSYGNICQTAVNFKVIYQDFSYTLFCYYNFHLPCCLLDHQTIGNSNRGKSDTSKISYK